MEFHLIIFLLIFFFSGQVYYVICPLESEVSIFNFLYMFFRTSVALDGFLFLSWLEILLHTIRKHVNASQKYI